jgi:hypothetical protein
VTVTPPAPVQPAAVVTSPTFVPAPAPAPRPTTPPVVQVAAAPQVENRVPAVQPTPVMTPTPVAPAIQPVASVAAPAPKPVPTPAVVQVSEQRVTAQPAPSGPISSPQVQSYLFQRIEEVGHGKVQDIRLQSKSNTECVIHVTVRNAADGQEVGKKIIRMPELTPYKVDLQVHIKP